MCVPGATDRSWILPQIDRDPAVATFSPPLQILDV
jgi:hypothetical protein